MSWFKWWVVGNLLCRPLKSLSPPPTPSFEGTEPFPYYGLLAELPLIMWGSCYNTCCFSTMSHLQQFSCNINWNRQWRSGRLGVDGQLLLGILHATTLELRRFIARCNQAMLTLENRILYTFLRWFLFLPHPQPWVRVQHPTQPVGLAGWHVRPPLCLWKKIVRTECFRVKPPWETFSVRFNIFFLTWSKCRVSCSFVRWRFNEFSFATCGQNICQRMSELTPVGLWDSLPLVVCLGWFGTGNKLLLLEG